MIPGGLSVGVALVALLTNASMADAQNCILPPPVVGIRNLAAIGSSPAAVSSMINSAITVANTAFLVQSTVYVSSPPNPSPDQKGGGVWIRDVGGTIDIKSSTITPVAATFPAGAAATVTCSQKVEENFAGVQFGADLARLNVSGWNFHSGITTGYIGTNSNLEGGYFAYSDPSNNNLPAGGGPFTSSTQIPFIGVYAATTKGGFFADALLRAEYFQTSLFAPATNLFGQSIDAHGYSFSSSVGYNWQVPNSSWFVEPSAGVIISRIKVDPFNFTTAGRLGPNLDDELTGTLQLSNIDSDIGRAGLRFGTALQLGNVLWQPFAAISVWHEFGSKLRSNYVTCPFCVVDGATFTTITASSSTSTFGTYGQYSLGVSAALAGTPWLGFARLDYRDGPNLQGISATSGLRYQFMPDAAVAKTATAKSELIESPSSGSTNWTGFYFGATGAAILGTADWNYMVGEANPHIGGYAWGGDVGFNSQFGNWVVGVELDPEKTNTTGGTACGPAARTPALTHGPMFQMTCNAWEDLMATATARIGYVWDRELFYAKAGGAWADQYFSATCNTVTVPNHPCTNATFSGGLFGLSNGFTANVSRVGLVIGYGAEVALTRNWSAKAEYDYVNFNDSGATASDRSRLNLGMHLSEAKVGLNWRTSESSVH